MAVCKKCKNQIPDGAIYCQYCGARQIAAPRKKAKEISVPKPKELPSGKWFIELRRERQYITEDTPELCVTKARAIRAGLLAADPKKDRRTLASGCRQYIDRRSAVLSPSTVNGYETIIRTRFAAYMGKQLGDIDYQRMVSDEARIAGAKTVKNAWGFIASVLRDDGVELPAVKLPQVVRRELPWLDYNQIAVFIDAIKEQPGELASLFALHGLRKSELLYLTPASIKDGVIHIEGSAVMGPGNKLVRKETNKNMSSRRTVRVMIPRLAEIISAWKGPSDEPYITCNSNTLHGQINAVCRRAGLPEVGVHGLRRSFASLAYHLGWSELETMRTGGWSDYQTMHNIYIKLSSADASAAAEKMSSFYEQNSE